MKAMILAAGLGTRLRPWTLHHPKALVPVDGHPMLERIITRLRAEGFNNLTVNVHHFGEQIIDFLSADDYRDIRISDEREKLLNTGGGVLKAVGDSTEPVLIHNVDILSTASLRELWEANALHPEAAATLLVSDRRSNRKLAFDTEGHLTGWANIATGETRGKVNDKSNLLAFSGIYIANPGMLHAMADYAKSKSAEFAVLDFFLSHTNTLCFRAHTEAHLRLLDIGKPDTLASAAEWLKETGL